MLKAAKIEESSMSDSETGKKIRISTTVRIKFRANYPEEFAYMRNARLNEAIASLFSKSAAYVEHYFKMGEEGSVWGEIRKGGSFYFISAIRDEYIDILTIQDDWKRPKNNWRRTERTASLKFMIKKANIKAVWPQVYRMLKNPPQGIQLGEFSAKLPAMNKIIIDDGSPSSNPSAIGHVTTEDVDGDGTLDVIHISSQRLAQELNRIGIGPDRLSNFQQLSPQDLYPVLGAFVELISHEMGHLADYSGNIENPFPGGEGAADTAAHRAIQQMRIATTNKIFRDKRGTNMSIVLNTLKKLANELDEIRATKLADEVTRLMEKIAATPEESAGPTVIGTHGEISIHGDPYTYNFDEKTQRLTVASVTIPENAPSEQSEQMSKAIEYTFSKQSNPQAWDNVVNRPEFLELFGNRAQIDHEGTVTFDGERIDRIPAHEIVKRGLIHCPERRRPFREMTVLDNLHAGAYIVKDKKETLENLQKVYELFPVLENRSRQISGTLSGGEQQMLAIGRALMSEPKLLCIDEPSTGLAPIAKGEVFDKIEEISGLGITVLLVEQEVSTVFKMASRNYVLSSGKIIAEGTGEQLLKDEIIRKTYLGL